LKKEKVQQVINDYRKRFEESGIGKADFTHEPSLDSPQHGLEHCHAMLDKMEVFLKTDRMGKVFRWLGFIQGVLWSHKICTLAELASHNRKDPK
jgi:hypothetical protein